MKLVNISLEIRSVGTGGQCEPDENQAFSCRAWAAAGLSQLLYKQVGLQPEQVAPRV